MIQLPWYAFSFILFAVSVLCLLIGSWMRGMGAEEEFRRLNDQVMLYKTCFERDEEELGRL